MKLIPGKYCIDENGNLSLPPEGFRIPIWDYIRMSLDVQGINEKYLLDLFDITPTSLYKWKKSTEETISKDKLVVLANLFGVTIDQLYERDFNDKYHYEDFYKLSIYQDNSDYKKLSYHDLKWLFEKLAEATTYIEYYSIGYVPLEVSEDDPDNDFDMINFSSDEVEYFCNNLSINVTYDTKDGMSHSISSITFRQVCEISEILATDWKNEAPKHIKARKDKKYYRMMMLSENIKFLNYAFEKWNLDINYCFSLWIMLKETNNDFDSNNRVVKLLLSKGAYFVDDNGNVDEQKTSELIRDIFKEDIEHFLDSYKEE